ncbi:MAG: phosphotransferase [Bacteroidota bacterium]
MQTFDTRSPITGIQHYLRSKKWLRPEEQIASIEKPGEGNMNVVLRIRTRERSFILKQSRPYVQKYQHIDAPLSRIRVEYEFYRAMQGGEASEYLPKILGYDDSNYVMLLEDLGNCEDLTAIYNGRNIAIKKVEQLISILNQVHTKSSAMPFPQNLEMRHLNHEHIFILPFLEDNGFSLDDVQPGLQQLAEPYKADSTLKKSIATIGQRYLSQGNTLLHGDYYPGSCMMEGNNLYVIDPEFSFMGFAEFDLGVMAAHLILATHKNTYLETVVKHYGGTADRTLTSQIAGIEMMRRIIGLAQLPLERTLDEKKSLLHMAHKMISL